MSRQLSPSLFALTLLACSREPDTFSPFAEAGETGTSITAEGAGEGEGDGDGDGDGGPKLDTELPDDNWNSMSDEQQLLVDSFPEFIATIEDTLPTAADFHIGVTKTDIFGFDDNPTPDPNNPTPRRSTKRPAPGSTASSLRAPTT